MKIIKANYEILDPIKGDDILRKIELYGRVCYKSEDRITDESSKNFVHSLIKRGHESVLEHHSFSVRFIVDRGVSHELVRHRIASYSQESTRYCNYEKDDEITFIEPSFYYGVDDHVKRMLWRMACLSAEKSYIALITNGSTPQEARSVLPNSLKTDIVVTMNLRGWRNFLKMRTPMNVHPQMREVTIPLLKELKERIPVIFDDIHSEV